MSWTHVKLVTSGYQGTPSMRKSREEWPMTGPSGYTQSDWNRINPDLNLESDQIQAQCDPSDHNPGTTSERSMQTCSYLVL
jgi:hypothetical protein